MKCKWKKTPKNRDCLPRCYQAETKAACRMWRSPIKWRRSSTRRSLWRTSCTWCSREASSGWVAWCVLRPDWRRGRFKYTPINNTHTHTSRRIFSHQWNSRASVGIKWYRGFNISWMSAAIAAGWRRITHHLLHYAVVKSFSGGRVLNDTIVGGGEHLQVSAPRKSSDHFVDSNGWKATAGVAFMQMFNVCLHPECIGYVPFVFISKAKL